MSAYQNQPSRAVSTQLEAVRRSDGAFDVDAWHVMEQRDDALIAQEVINGVGSSKFVYNFDIGGKQVSGISVVGARHLASHYGGIKHSLLASVSKIGNLFVFTTYPSGGNAMNVTAQIIDALKEQDDFYEVLIEVEDIKKGNSIQVRKRESATEKRRDGTRFDRPHYSLIAEGKAYRNGVLALIDQGVQLRWKIEMIELGKDVNLTGSILEEKRAGVLRYAASNGIGVDRRALEALTMDQIAGLGDAAREGKAAQFREAANVLGVLSSSGIVQQSDAAPAHAAISSGAAKAGAAAHETESRPVETKTAAKADPKANQTPLAVPTAEIKPSASVPFNAYLVDEFGEMGGEDGEESHFTSADRYLSAVLRMTHSAQSIAMVLENNAEDIASARKVASATMRDDFDAEIASMLTPKPANVQASVPAAVSAPSSQPMPVQVPVKSGKSHLAGYLELVFAELDAIKTPAALTEWTRLNESVIATLPSVTRKNTHKAIADTADRLGASKSSPAAAPPADDDPPPNMGDAADTPEQETFKRLLRRVNGCTSAADLDALGMMSNFRSEFSTLPKDLSDRLTSHGKELRASFAPKATANE